MGDSKVTKDEIIANTEADRLERISMMRHDYLERNKKRIKKYQHSYYINVIKPKREAKKEKKKNDGS